MRSYAEIRDATKSAYLEHHATLWERLGFVSPYGALRDEATFNRVHAAFAKAVADHGPFDASIDFRRHAWTGKFVIVHDASCEHGFRVVCTDRFHIDKAQVIEEILGAVLAIVITLAFPGLVLLAGFIGTCLVGLGLLFLAEVGAEFVTGLCAGADAQGGYLNQLATEAVA